MRVLVWVSQQRKLDWEVMESVKLVTLGYFGNVIWMNRDYCVQCVEEQKCRRGREESTSEMDQ